MWLSYKISPYFGFQDKQEIILTFLVQTWPKWASLWMWALFLLWRRGSNFCLIACIAIPLMQVENWSNILWWKLLSTRLSSRFSPNRKPSSQVSGGLVWFPGEKLDPEHLKKLSPGTIFKNHHHAELFPDPGATVNLSPNLSTLSEAAPTGDPEPLPPVASDSACLRWCSGHWGYSSSGHWQQSCLWICSVILCSVLLGSILLCSIHLYSMLLHIFLYLCCRNGKGSSLNIYVQGSISLLHCYLTIVLGSNIWYFGCRAK